MKKEIKTNPKKNKISIISKPYRHGALNNIYDAIQSCKREEIIVLVDGDDWLYNCEVLSKINRVYSGRKKVWLTHGSYITASQQKGFDKKIPQKVYRNNLFREYSQPTHLRTFYAWLFQKINRSDLIYDDLFLKCLGTLLSCIQ